MRRGWGLVAGGVGLVLLAGCGGPDTGSVDSAAIADRRGACVGCHGKTGIAQAPVFPTIAGQPTDYLVRAMTDYRDGARQNAIMNAQMQNFTDAEIHALAVYYHRQTSPLARHIAPQGSAADNKKGETQ